MLQSDDQMFQNQVNFYLQFCKFANAKITEPEMLHQRHGSWKEQSRLRDTWSDRPYKSSLGIYTFVVITVKRFKITCKTLYINQINFLQNQVR